MLQRAQKKVKNGMVLHASVVDYVLYSLVRCLVFSQAAGMDGLHEVTTFQVDQHVHKSAELTGDSLLLAKLSLGDMVALEVKYHTKCLLALYNRARKVQVEQQGAYSEDDEISGIVFAELVKKFVWKQALHQFSNSLIWPNSTC